MKNIPIFTRSVMVLMCIFILGACASTPPPQTSVPPTVLPRPQPTATATPTLPPLGPAPKDCPLSPPLRHQRLSSAIVPLYGLPPVWGTVGDGGITHLAGDTYDPDGGWPVKIVWEIGPNYQHPVMLRAGNLRDGTLLKWKMSPDEHVTTAPVLDPQHPGHPVSVIGGDWNEWGS